MQKDGVVDDFSDSGVSTGQGCGGGGGLTVSLINGSSIHQLFDAAPLRPARLRYLSHLSHIDGC